MYNKIKLALATAVVAGSLLAGAASAKADEIVINGSHRHHHWMRARNECVEQGGFWADGGCRFNGRVGYRPHYIYRDGYRGYYRNGLWIRL